MWIDCESILDNWVDHLPGTKEQLEQRQGGENDIVQQSGASIHVEWEEIMGIRTPHL